METGILFLALIVFIGLVHFAASVAKIFSNKQRPITSLSRTRDDWYCFFHRSALIAPPKNISKPAPPEPEHIYESEPDSQALASFSRI